MAVIFQELELDIKDLISVVMTLRKDCLFMLDVYGDLKLEILSN